MVYVERIKARGRTYYRLAHSIRKGQKLTHKVKHLGKTLPSPARLEQLKQEFLQGLTQPKYRYLSDHDVRAIEQKKAEYQQELSSLSSRQQENKLREFIVRFTYDSSKLSGVAVTLRQTFLILQEGIMPKDLKNLRTARELENHQRGVLAITKYQRRLTVKFMKKLHTILFAGVDDSVAGKLRDELEKNVKIAGTSYVPPPWPRLKKELEQFLAWYKVESRTLHPLELAALIHARIITLQPFADGNSRLSRLLMNWILWKKHYPPIDIPIEDLENYYQALDQYQIEKKEQPFVNYIKKRYLVDGKHSFPTFK